MNNKGRVRHALVGMTLVVFGIGIIMWGRNTSVQQTRVKINNSTILVDIADESNEISRGLGGRKSMLPNEGMLFVFDAPGTPSFWMKDMLFSLDFVWIAENGRIVAITPSIGIDSYPITFTPPEPIKFVLEVNAGISASRGWQAGDTAEIKL